MQYLVLIDGDEHALRETERQACYVESRQRVHEREVSGQYLAANPLHPTARAITVARARRQTVRDGWSVRGDARTTRRLLASRRQASRRGGRHRRTDSHGA
jgi:hypothetical protein